MSVVRSVNSCCASSLTVGAASCRSACASREYCVTVSPLGASTWSYSRVTRRVRLRSLKQVQAEGMRGLYVYLHLCSYRFMPAGPCRSASTA